MMKTHAIIEIEEGVLHAVVGECDRDVVRVTKSVTVSLPDSTKESIGSALRNLKNETLRGLANVHVVFGDRRSHHFLTEMPKMSLADAKRFVEREALRVSGSSDIDALLLESRLVRVLEDGRLLVATTVVNRLAWSPISSAFEEAGLIVSGLHTVEAGVAMATPAGMSDPVAVLECNAGRARFILSVDQFPVQVRRFLVGTGGEVAASTLLTQLMMELPRTMDWLSQSGYELPAWLMLGNRVPVDDESLDMLRGESLEQISRATLPIAAEDEDGAVGIGAAHLLRSIALGERRGNLLAPSPLRLPMSRRRIAYIAGAAAIAMAGAGSAILDGVEWWRNDAEATSLRDERVGLEAAREGFAAPMGEVEPDLGSAWLQQALKSRRPISRFVAEVSNSCVEGVFLEELTFASRTRLTITGFVEGRSRREALGRMAEFTHELGSLEFLHPERQEEVSEIAGLRTKYRFRLGLMWRNEQ